ncbi:hypothetical protein A2U01_0082570, partial [Trifolium medium]|nr:hypothetical protein [Trifolium medium]
MINNHVTTITENNVQIPILVNNANLDSQLNIDHVKGRDTFYDTIQNINDVQDLENVNQIHDNE